MKKKKKKEIFIILIAAAIIIVFIAVMASRYEEESFNVAWSEKVTDEYSTALNTFVEQSFEILTEEVKVMDLGVNFYALSDSLLDKNIGASERKAISKKILEDAPDLLEEEFGEYRSLSRKMNSLHQPLVNIQEKMKKHTEYSGLKSISLMAKRITQKFDLLLINNADTFVVFKELAKRLDDNGGYLSKIDFATLPGNEIIGIESDREVKKILRNRVNLLDEIYIALEAMKKMNDAIDLLAGNEVLDMLYAKNKIHFIQMTDIRPLLERGWLKHKNDDLGINFEYPQAWGEPTAITGNNPDGVPGVFSGISFSDARIYKDLVPQMLSVTEDWDVAGSIAPFLSVWKKNENASEYCRRFAADTLSHTGCAELPNGVIKLYYAYYISSEEEGGIISFAQRAFVPLSDDTFYGLMIDLPISESVSSSYANSPTEDLEDFALHSIPVETALNYIKLSILEKMLSSIRVE